MAQFNIYQAVTDRIISQLEKGVIPWRKPWKVSGVQIRFKEDLTKLAFNRVTKLAYGALNQMLLPVSFSTTEISTLTTLTT